MIPAWIAKLMAEERARTAPRGPVRQEDLDEMLKHEGQLQPGQRRLAFPGWKEFDEATGEYKPQQKYQ
jgi:hypothetical protein